MMSEDPDRVLIERLRRGDKAACAECTERHSPGAACLNAISNRAKRALDVSINVVKVGLHRSRPVSSKEYGCTFF